MTEGWQLLQWECWPRAVSGASTKAGSRSALGSCGHLAWGRQRDPLCESYTFFGAKQKVLPWLSRGWAIDQPGSANRARKLLPHVHQKTGELPCLNNARVSQQSRGLLRFPAL